MIGSSVETQLADTLEKLILGDLELHDLCSPLAGFYVAGHAAGMAASPDLQRLTWERDAWFFVACNRGKTIADFYTHQTSALWAAEAIA